MNSTGGLSSASWSPPTVPTDRIALSVWSFRSRRPVPVAVQLGRSQFSAGCITFTYVQVACASGFAAPQVAVDLDRWYYVPTGALQAARSGKEH